MVVYFIVAQTIGKSKKFKLSDGEYVILGRSEKSCQVQIDDVMCSNKHCKISMSNNCIYVEDLDSKNGIYLNGVRILKQRFYLTDKLKIGENIVYIASEKLSDEDRTYLGFSGDSTRIKGGLTLEIDKNKFHDKSSASRSNLSSHRKSVSKKRDSTSRRKAYADHRKSPKSKKSSIQTQALEAVALVIDIIIGIVVFMVAIFSFRYVSNETYTKLSEKHSDFQMMFTDEMNLYALGSIVVTVILFNLNRKLESGSIGEKVLKVN